MSVQKGLWSISKGKGNRIYINCDNTYTGPCEGVMHPEQLAELNGVGMYGMCVLDDLYDAIKEFKGRYDVGGRVDFDHYWEGDYEAKVSAHKEKE